MKEDLLTWLSDSFIIMARSRYKSLSVMYSADVTVADVDVDADRACVEVEATSGIGFVHSSDEVGFICIECVSRCEINGGSPTSVVSYGS